MIGNPQTGPLTDTCGVTMTFSHSYCNHVDGSWSSTHSGLHGTQTWIHGDDVFHPNTQCNDSFTVSLHAGDIITFTATGDFPYGTWIDDHADRNPPNFWCEADGFQIVTSTLTYFEEVYVAPAGTYDHKICKIGHDYGYEGRWYVAIPHSLTFSWSWTVGVPCEHCVVKDPHMEMAPPTSPWENLEGDYETIHTGSEWLIWYPGYVRQSIVLTTGMYSVLVRARQFAGGAPTTLQIQLDTNLSEIEVNSTSLKDYTVLVFSDGGPQDLILHVKNSASAVYVDYVCILEAQTCSLPCGMGTSDAMLSKQYLLNSEMYGLEFPPGLWAVNCSVGVAVPGSVGVACWQKKEDIGLLAYHWSGSGANQAVSGVKRWSIGGLCGQALGLMPPPLQNGTSQVLNMRPDGPYNIALKMKRDYGNSRLTVCGQTIDYTPVGEWIDVSFYCPDGRNDVTLLADCTGGSCVSHYQGPTVADYSAVEVDDVYLIPGGEISCTVPLVVPTLDCINHNPHLIGFSSRPEMMNGPSQIGTEEGWNLSNARMGSISAREFAHQARLWPSNGDTFIHQYVNADPGSIADVGAIVPGRSYSITVSARRYDSDDATIDVAVGAQSAGEQTWDIPLSGANASTVWSHGFVASSDMFNGNNMGLRVGNSGGSVLLDSVCISTGGPPITPTHSCLGDWLSSSGGNPYDGLTPAEDYVYNVTDLNGYYRLDVAGVADSSGSLDIEYYWDVPNPPTEGGEHSDISSIAVDGAFTATVTFPSGYTNGQLRIVTHQNTTFTSICLSKYDAPGGDGPPLPGPSPIPECGSVSSNIRSPLFYMLSPYSATVEYTGTAPAYYVAELTYDYAIYPLVCTTISIANWQFDAYNQFKAAFDKMVLEFEDYYRQIIAVLWAIYDKLGQSTTGGSEFLGLLWQLFLMLLRLLLKLLGLVYQVLDLVITTLKNLSVNSKGSQAVTYPIRCTGDAKWMCFGLASIIAVDNYAGNWIRLVVLLALGSLTVGLIFWLSGQIRAMAQPGDTKSHE